ncbi:hypothetical protein CAL13_03635 [Bordetella genomosp. 9]|uniref:Uncharacterized protein n=1 Tax=Bordetella genomosp. 9 TaxID=1416803 RepID=A0A1W6YWK9_9BORD|nr:hypothetical protein CAL13_03635 [Bordetella genomosp. 9]ARP89388.1 hypothetical protein CAL14_03005 [Bordetella genomosp. 9]
MEGPDRLEGLHGRRDAGTAACAPIGRRRIGRDVPVGAAARPRLGEGLAGGNARRRGESSITERIMKRRA